jgi:hypothetical protein
VDAIDKGLTPFSMCPTGYYKADQQSTTNGFYTMLGGSPNLTDLQSVITTNINLPANLFQLLHFIGAYSVTIDVLLGTEGPLARALYRFFQFLYTNMNAVSGSINEDDILMFMFKVLRHVQLITITYINQKINLQIANVPDPDFGPIEQAISYRMFSNFPNIPRRFLKDMRSAAGLPERQKAGNNPTAGATPVANAAGAATPTTWGTPVTAPATDIVQEWVTAFGACRKSVRTLRALPAEKLPMAADNRTKICLAWHLQTRCFDNCYSKSTHRVLTSTEHQVFAAFCTAEF